jgi:dienelactone hydrolase
MATAVSDIKRYTRTIQEVWEMWQPHIKQQLHPFCHTNYEDNEKIFKNLKSLDRDAWAAEFANVAKSYEERAVAAELQGFRQVAQENYWTAYGHYRMGRFPAPNSPGKREVYKKSQQMVLKALAYAPYSVERVEMPFKGRAGEGKASIGHLYRPRGAARLPVVQLWGGIDTFKEDRTALAEDLLKAGMAALLIDMPGVGDAPLAGSEDAERMWDAVFDWIATRPDLDSSRVGIWGGSTGGYWAAKVAHTHKDRMLAAVCHGGCAHYAFEPRWIEKAQHGSYAFELAETLASAFGRATFEEWVEYCPRLSLLGQGVIDKPCAPLLLVNGIKDSIFPIEDMYLLLEHGGPKAARFYDSGHMGNSPTTIPTIVGWLKEKLN